MSLIVILTSLGSMLHISLSRNGCVTVSNLSMGCHPKNAVVAEILGQVMFFVGVVSMGCQKVV